MALSGQEFFERGEVVFLTLLCPLMIAAQHVILSRGI